MTHTRRARPAALALLLLAATSTAGCAPHDDVRKPETVATNSASPQQVESLRTHLAALAGVRDVQLKFVPAAKFYEPVWKATITADGLDKTALVGLLDQAYRAMWNDATIPYGDPNFEVTNGAGTVVGGADLGFNGAPMWRDLNKRYGARPTSTR